MLSNIRKVSKEPLGPGLRLLTLTLGLILIVVACGGPETVAPMAAETEVIAPAFATPTAPAAESVAPGLTPSTTPDMDGVTPVPTAPATPVAESVVPVPTPDYSNTSFLPPPAHYGAATPSVEERIYDSEVIIRASLQPSGTGSLRFRAIEYLKGAGPAEIVVLAATYGRNTAWDDREAVLFLDLPEEQATSGASGSAGEVAAGKFVFTNAHGFNHPIYEGRSKLPTGYTIDTRNPVWLPTEAEPGAGGAVGDGAGNPAFITDSATPAGVPPSTISLSDLRSKITWVDGGEDVDGYDRCIGVSLNYQKYYRDWEAYYGRPWSPHQAEEQVASGAAEGAVVDDYGSVYEPGYHRFWLTGADAELFQAQIVDDDEVASNGYTPTLATARPLPGGVYRFLTHLHSYEYVPCNFTPENNRLEWTVTAIAPDSAVHEAFFDPVAIGGAVGADAANGVLKPASFSLTGGGSTVTLSKIAWESGRATVELDPSLSLADHHADFIALDGSVSLRLDFDDATETVDGTKRTLAWNVCAQPWESGDLLMLRISSSGETSPA